MLRRVRWLVALLVLIVFALTLGAWLMLRGSLPALDGNLSVADLSAPVSIERDHLGTVTLRGKSRLDLDRAIGFVHAQDRFFQMDLLRRRAAGELAELFGAAALPVDRIARAHRMRARAEIALAHLDADQRTELAAYRDGVNAGLASLSMRPLAYLLTGTTPTPWRSVDTLLVIDAMAFTLNDPENKRELAFSTMRAALPDSAYRFLTASGGAWDTPLAGAPQTWPDPPTAAELDLRTLDPHLFHDATSVGERERTSTDAEARLEPTSPHPVQPVAWLRSNWHAQASGALFTQIVASGAFALGKSAPAGQAPGSNSLAVAGALTGGAALVANDMHLDLGVPNIWYRARLIYPDPRQAGTSIEISGAMLPGAPAFVVGSNRHIAWGFTNSYIDSADWVRVTVDPNDPDRYRSANGWQPIQTHVETIHIHGGADETLVVRDTGWGPILAKDVDGTPLALAWTAQQPGAINLDLEQLERAKNAHAAVAIAQRAGMPAQNFVVGDRSGSIEWTLAGRIPKRVGNYDPMLPADWSQPGTGWDGWLDPNSVPLIANPPWQRMWTANQRIVEGSALATLGDGGYDIGARARQIRDDLRARDHFTPADMLRIQLDDRALFLERWKDLLKLELNRASTSGLNEAMKKALADWSGHASIDSVSYRLVRAWRNEVIDSALDGFAAAVRSKYPDFSLPKLSQAGQAVWELVNRQPMNLLRPGYADWDALLIACAERTGKKLDAQPGGIAMRTWGERNTTHIANPLSRALPAFVARWLDMPYQPLPGDSNMPRVQAPSFGASERFAVAPGDEMHGYFMMPGGQSGHPLSPYYGSGHADWATGTPTPFLPGASQHRLILSPTP